MLFNCRSCDQEATDRYPSAGLVCKPCVITANSARAKLRHPLYAALSNAKHRAKRDGRDFAIGLDDLPMPAVCPLLGIDLVYGGTKRSAGSPTIDRLDSRFGYTPENVWVISERANRIKNNATVEELEKIAEGIRRAVVGV